MEGVAIRQARKGAGMSQAQLATALGVSQTLVAAWEMGRRTVSAYHAEHLRTALGVREPEPIPFGDFIDEWWAADDATVGQIWKRCGAELRRCRKGAGLAVEEAAPLVGERAPRWYAWEQGKRRPKPKSMRRLRGKPIYLPAIVAAWWRYVDADPEDPNTPHILGVLAADLGDQKKLDLRTKDSADSSTPITAQDLQAAIRHGLPLGWLPPAKGRPGRWAPQDRVKVVAWSFALDCVMFRRENKQRCRYALTKQQRVEALARGIDERHLDLVAQGLSDFAELTTEELDAMYATITKIEAEYQRGYGPIEPYTDMPAEPESGLVRL